MYESFVNRQASRSRIMIICCDTVQLFVYSRPTVLDNFALLSGQISSLNRLLKNEKTSVLRNHVLIPLVLAVDRDPDLEVCLDIHKHDQEKIIILF